MASRLRLIAAVESSRAFCAMAAARSSAAAAWPGELDQRRAVADEILLRRGGRGCRASSFAAFAWMSAVRWISSIR